MSVPATKPAPQRAASTIDRAFQRAPDGVAQVMMNGVITKAAKALGTHYWRMVMNNSSDATAPANTRLAMLKAALTVVPRKQAHAR